MENEATAQTLAEEGGGESYETEETVVLTYAVIDAMFVSEFKK